MVPPWYRSRLFWLGMLPAVFLLWAWWDAGERIRQAQWSSASRLYLAGNSPGGVFLFEFSSRGYRISGAANPVETQHLSPEQRSVLPRRLGLVFPPWLSFGEYDETTGPGDITSARTIVISHWLLFLCYLAFLAAALCGWQWRKRKEARRVAIH